MNRRLLVLGGGQLARMAGQEASSLGVELYCLDAEGCCATNTVQGVFAGDFKNYDDILRAADKIKPSHVSVEIEGVNTQALRELMNLGIPVNPFPDTLENIRDKFVQHKLFEGNRVPVAKTTSFNPQLSSQDRARAFGDSFFLKRRVGAFDGRGNYHVGVQGSFEEGVAALGGTHADALYLEKEVKFAYEASVIGVRDMQGNVKFYDPGLNVHKNGILDHTIFPSPFEKDYQAILETAKRTLNVLGGAGVFGIEMFVKKDGSVLVNEVAPRVHNSGHQTIQAAATSQFKNWMSVVTGGEILPVDTLEPAIMANFVLGVGETMRDTSHLGLSPQMHVHDYEKGPGRAGGRKCGHLTALDCSMPHLDKVLEVRDDLRSYFRSRA